VIELVAVLVIAVILMAITLVAIQGQKRERVRDRLRPGGDPNQENTAVEQLPSQRNLALRRFRFVPWLLAAVLGFSLWYVMAWPIGFAIAIAVVAGLLGWQLEDWWHGKRTDLLENQLADAIDLMVAAVKAGSGLQAALESASGNARRPLKPQLDEVIGRIRLGDDPIESLMGLSDRVPLETFRLFTTALAVNWQVGGRLAQTLANVSRTIRDRIELTRRMNSMSTQARFSVASVLGVTYFLGALIWRNDPQRMQGFLASNFGQYATIAAVILQGLGVVWVARLSKIKF
jgi:tight adherence protein B